ncbi:hypothetical protein IQ244_31025 [Nostoc sp. LEGE 06077]|uniref:hypothetical protein n=1 Tax=Nostoc sp. LEGE 06077 TaxID=915325 RepID=UPI00187F9E60|nr:hypothetical protein [Nostoc sp. LEGE 06077]MBE9210856.1 hypothetical protein [Nostoc sp. LEGE 06077]
MSVKQSKSDRSWRKIIDAIARFGKECQELSAGIIRDSQKPDLKLCDRRFPFSRLLNI